MQTTLTGAMEFIDSLTQSPSQAPQLILMCLDAPRLVLMSLVVEAKRNPRLRWIPTVVLLDGNSLHDINALYDMNVNCVLPKNKALVADGELLQNTCHSGWNQRYCRSSPLRHTLSDPRAYSFKTLL